MPRNEFYCQCKLQRPVGGGGIEVMVSWIPSDIAKAGNKVRLKEWPGDEWSEGWTIFWVTEKVSGDNVESRELDYKHQREFSDV